MKIEEREKRAKEDGFTLIEAMIALVVLLVGMLGVIGMQYYAVTGNSASRELRIATNLGEELIEQMKSTPYANLVSGTDNPAVNTTLSGGVAYTRAWWVLADCVSFALAGDDNTCNANLAPNCTRDPDGGSAVAVSSIRSRACWTDKNGTTHSVTLDTLRWNENVLP